MRARTIITATGFILVFLITVLLPTIIENFYLSICMGVSIGGAIAMIGLSLGQMVEDWQKKRGG